jgi:uncharacterized protein DUF4349
MRFRDGEQPDPGAARELAAVDSALAGRPVEPGQEQLAELTLALRAERPVPEERFARHLDAIVARGFRPATAEASARKSGLPGFLRSRLRLALATVASVFIAGTAVFSSGILNGDDGAGLPAGERSVPATRSTADGSAATAPEVAPGAGGVVAPQPLTVSPPVNPAPTNVAPGVRQRKVERQAALVLAAAPQDVEGVADDAIAVVDRHRGFVLSSSVRGGDDAGASLDLRIPAARLDEAVADLSRLGHVRSREQSSQDVTARFVSTQARLREAQAERRSLLRQLAAADTLNETASVRARLREVNRRIARSRSQLAAQRARIQLAAVSLTIEADGAVSRKDDGGWTPGDALHDAGQVLGTSLAAALLVLALAVPASALGLGGWALWRVVARRRRERVLTRGQKVEESASR